MPLPSSGVIKFSDINVELGVAANTSRKLSDSAVRTLFEIASGRITLSNGFGKSNLRTVIAMSSALAPYVYAWPWSNGFGAKYADPSAALSSPGSLKFTHSSTAIAVVQSGTPGIVAYSWSSGFGSKYADPATPPPTIVTTIAFTPSDDAIAVASTTGIRISAYSWSNTTGVGIKYADPASLPLGARGQGVCFNPQGTVLAMVQRSYVEAWSFSSGFGSKYTSPTQLGSGNNLSAITFNPQGTALAVPVANIAPYIHVWAWSNGFGSKYAAPATPIGSNPLWSPQGSAWNATFSPSGNAIAVGHNHFPFVTVYAWSNGFGSKYADPVTPINLNYGMDQVSSVGFNISETVIVLCAYQYQGTGGIMQAYVWSNGFGAKYADPANAPTNSSRLAVNYI